MSSKNQTPAPKVSSDADKGRMNKPATEHIESVSAGDNGDETLTTQEMQEKYGRDKINREGNDKDY